MPPIAVAPAFALAPSATANLPTATSAVCPAYMAPRSLAPVDPSSLSSPQLLMLMLGLSSPSTIVHSPSSFSRFKLAASIFTSVISISPAAINSALPSTVPPPPQIPPQSTDPSMTIAVTSPENSSTSRLVTCNASTSPKMLIDEPATLIRLDAGAVVASPEPPIGAIVFEKHVPLWAWLLAKALRNGLEVTLDAI